MERTIKDKVALLVEVAELLPPWLAWVVLHKPGDVTALMVLSSSRQKVEVVAEVGGYDLWVNGTPEFDVSAERAAAALISAVS